MKKYLYINGTCLSCVFDYLVFDFKGNVEQKELYMNSDNNITGSD